MHWNGQMKQVKQVAAAPIAMLGWGIVRAGTCGSVSSHSSAEPTGVDRKAGPSSSPEGRLGGRERHSWLTIIVRPRTSRAVDSLQVHLAAPSTLRRPPTKTRPHGHTKHSSLPAASRGPPEAPLTPSPFATICSPPIFMWTFGSAASPRSPASHSARRASPAAPPSKAAGPT